MSARAFDLGDVLTVTTGRLLSPRHVDGLYDILNFLTGDSLYTHQLPRACDQCTPEILRQHPDLGAIEVPADLSTEADVITWLDATKLTYGTERTLTPLTEYQGQDPIDELADKVGAERIWVVPEARNE